MTHSRFRPQLETLEALVLPSNATPLTASIVGPFAPGMYPTDPPPGPGGGQHRWLFRFEARADGWTAEGDSELSGQPGQSGNVRADLNALSQLLFTLAGQERALASADGSRAALALATGHLGQAARWGMEEYQHSSRADQYSAGWQSIDGILLQQDDTLLRLTAQSLEQQWLVTAVGWQNADAAALAAANAPGQTWHQLQQNLFTYGGVAASFQGAGAVYAGLNAIVGGD
jgi:hypothetical protein